MKKDLFNECYDGKVSPEEFRATFCDHCRNPTCALAQWGDDKFGHRVNTQMDKLFNPVLADPNNPKYSRLRERDFPSLFKQAIRLEAADRAGDWEIPTENVVLATIAPEQASESSQDKLEEALKSLKNQDQEEDQQDQEISEDLPSEPPEANLGDQGFENEIQTLEKEIEKPPENQDPNRQSLENNFESSTQSENTPRQRVASSSSMNTDFSDGFTIGGDLPSQDIDATPTKRKRVLDSWGSSDSKVVEPGTKVNMGKKK